MTHRRSKGDRAQGTLPQALYDELIELIKAHGREANRTNKIVSHETGDVRREMLLLSFRELHGLGYRLQSANSLQQRHVKALVQSWEESGLSPSSIANRLSVLRALCKWIGKKGMIQKSTDFVQKPESVIRSQATTEDKSWTAKGIEIDRLIGMIETYDWRVGLQTKLMRAFGLRKREAVMFRPLKADMGFAIRVRDGTKGGRERVVPVETPEQRQLLDLAKSKVSTVNEHLSNPNYTLEQAVRRVNYCFERYGITKRDLGVTAHGLRHEHLNELYERVTGVPSPVRSGSVTHDLDRLTHDIARARVSQEAGHSRLGISDAYIGARPADKRTPEQKETDRRYRELLTKEDLSDSESAELGRLVKAMHARTQRPNRDSAPVSDTEPQQPTSAHETQPHAHHESEEQHA